MADLPNALTRSIDLCTKGPTHELKELPVTMKKAHLIFERPVDDVRSLVDDASTRPQSDCRG